MATQIQIKRGAATAETAPGTLAAGELAVTYGDASSQANGGDRYIQETQPEMET